MTASTSLEVQLLGEFRVVVAGQEVPGDRWRRRRAAALIKLLALAPNHRLHREQLCDVLWPELARDNALENLRSALLHGRKRLEEAGAPENTFLVREGEFIVLGPPDAVIIDVHDFVRASAVAASAEDPAVIEAALMLYRGDLLPDDVYEEWEDWGGKLAERRESLHSNFRELLRRLAVISIKAGQGDKAVTVLERLLLTDPTDEDAHIRLMRVLARTGYQQRALAQYDQLVAALQVDADAKPLPRTTRLRDDIEAGRFPPPVSPATTAKSITGPLAPLPVPLDRLIGREREVAEISHLVASKRLVTLTGPGGVGKTRLALAVAKEVSPDVPDGVTFIDLAPLRDQSLVVPTIAQALGVQEEPQTPLRATLMSSIRGRSQFLLIDNFEHVLEAAPVVAELLAASPGLRVLATSRTRLRLGGEHVYPVAPFSRPSLRPGQRVGPPLEHFASQPAVALFVERARAVKPSFHVTEENVEHVATLCSRLDGLPLAIELAAALVRVLTPAAISARLEARGGSSLTLLPTGSQDAPRRQQTLHALISWSYEMLTPPQRVLFERLSVFVGGWTLELADVVTNLEDAPAHQTHVAIDELIDHGLVIESGSTYDMANSETLRFSMLETIRDFAAEQREIRTSGEAIQRRHADTFVDLAELASRKLVGLEQIVWLDLLEIEHGNLREALAWSLKNEPSIALRLAGNLARFWYMRGHWSEGRRWLDQSLDIASQTPTLDRARALLGMGVLTEAQGHPDLALTLYEEARIAFSELEYQPGLCHALNNLGNVLDLLDHPRESVAHYQEALAVCRGAMETQGVAHALQNLGIVAALRGETDDGVRMLSESLALQRELGDRFGVSEVLATLGSLEFREGHLERARAIHAEVLSLTRELGDQTGEASAIVSLGEVALQLGELEDAEELFKEALILFQELEDPGGEASINAGLGMVALRHDQDCSRAMRMTRKALLQFEELGDQEQMCWCLDAMATVYFEAGNWKLTARLLGAADSLRKSIHVRVPAVYRAEQQHVIAKVRAELGPDMFEDEWKAGALDSIATIAAYGFEDTSQSYASSY